MDDSMYRRDIVFQTRLEKAQQAIEALQISQTGMNALVEFSKIEPGQLNNVIEAMNMYVSADAEDKTALREVFANVSGLILGPLSEDDITICPQCGQKMSGRR